MAQEFEVGPVVEAARCPSPIPAATEAAGAIQKRPTAPKAYRPRLPTVETPQYSPNAPTENIDPRWMPASAPTP